MLFRSGNIEIIIVDDETKDKSVEIAERVLASSSRPFKIIHEYNKGLPGARNNGYKSASGEYVCFIDTDDVISKDHILNLMNMVKKENLSVAFSDFECTTLNNREGNDNTYQMQQVYSRDSFLTMFMKRNPAVHCCSMLFRRSMLEDNGLYFNEKLRYGEDAEFMWRVFSANTRIGHYKQKSYKYLIRSNSIMTTVGMERGIVFSEELKKTLDQLKIDYPQYKSVYDMAYCRYMLGWLRTVAINSNFDMFRKCTEIIPYKILMKQLKKFPDIKVRFSARLLLLSRYLFYKVFNTTKAS